MDQFCFQAYLECLYCRYKEHFGLTAREGIALTGGAHSYGKFNSEVSMLRYFWTRGQHNIMNNQVFKHLSQRPQYFLECKDHLGQKEFRLVGDANGNKAETKWNVNAGGFSKSGGPFQWFHRCFFDRQQYILRLKSGHFLFDHSKVVILSKGGHLTTQRWSFYQKVVI